MWTPPKPATAADLAEWVVSTLRYSSRGDATKKWLLVDAGDGQPARLSRIERGRRFAKRTEYEETKALAGELAEKLARRWPVQRNGGRTYLTPAGVLDLVDPVALANARVEAKRLAKLDAEEQERRSRVERAAEQAFEALEGVRDLSDTRSLGHTCRGQWDAARTCSGCATAAAARRRASDRASVWLHTRRADLQDRDPLRAAGENEESAALALFILEGDTGWTPAAVAAGGRH